MANTQYYGGNLIPLTPQTVLAAFTSVGSTTRVNPGANRNVRVTCITQALWIKLGTGSVTATAGTASEVLCPPGHTDINMGDATHLAYIQDASASRGCIFTF